MISEFWVPISHERADVVALGETLDGYEIKTVRDSLRRLERQVTAYGRVFDHCTVVLAQKHLDAALGILPDWWGVWLISPGPEVAFQLIRPAAENPATDPETLVRLLWRDEAYSALQEVGPSPDPNTPRMSLWQNLLDVAPEAKLRTLVRDALRRRDPGKARIRSKRFRAALESA